MTSSGGNTQEGGLLFTTKYWGLTSKCGGHATVIRKIKSVFLFDYITDWFMQESLTGDIMLRIRTFFFFLNTEPEFIIWHWTVTGCKPHPSLFPLWSPSEKMDKKAKMLPSLTLAGVSNQSSPCPIGTLIQDVAPKLNKMPVSFPYSLKACLGLFGKPALLLSTQEEKIRALFIWIIYLLIPS